MAPVLDDELTIAEAAALAETTERTIRNWINGGKLAAKNEREGRKVRRRDVLTILENKGFVVTPMESAESAEAITTETAEGAEMPPATNTHNSNGHAETMESAARPETPPRESAEAVERSEALGAERAERGESPERAGVPRPDMTEIAELLNIIVQPLTVQLEAERSRSDRLQRESMQLAGQAAFFQAKSQDLEQKLLAAQTERRHGPVVEGAETVERPKTENAEMKEVTERPNMGSAERSEGLESAETETVETAESAERLRRDRRKPQSRPWWKRALGL